MTSFISSIERERPFFLSFNLPTVHEIVSNVRLAVALLRDRDGAGMKSYPIHLRYPGREFFEDERIEASVAFGSLLCDGIGDSAQAGQGAAPKKDLPS